MSYKLYVTILILKMILGLIILGVLVAYFLRETLFYKKKYEFKKFSQKDIKKRIERANRG